MLEYRYPCAGYWFNMLPIHLFIHGPVMPLQTQLQGPATVPPSYSLQGMLLNPNGVVCPDTALSTQQPCHSANTIVCKYSCSPTR
jgi:hypothetical protein